MTPTYLETKDALLSGDITLHYQPIHSLSTGALLGYEALARWGTMPPPQIAAIVEEHSLQALWLKCQVAQINEVLAHIPLRMWVSVNINQSALALRQLPDLLGDTPDPKRLVIEILEAVRITDPIANVLENLQCTHVLRADDVGGLEHGWLDRFIGSAADYFDGLKLCHGLTHNVHTNRRTALFCAMMLTLAEELELSTVAEWVHNPVQRDWLRDHGCDMGQGELYSMPTPWGEIAKQKTD